MTRNKFPSEIKIDAHTFQLAKEAAANLGCTEILTKSFLYAAFIAAQVFDYKQAKYGPGNIAEFAETGVMIRCTDKIKRIANLWRKGETPTDESIEDSWGDLANYGLIALMCRWGMWPGVEAAPVRESRQAAVEANANVDEALRERWIHIWQVIESTKLSDAEKVKVIRSLPPMGFIKLS